MTTRPVPFHALAIAVALVATPLASHAIEASVTNLVTDDPGANPGKVTDPGLVNAWGISSSPTSPFWVSSNGGGTSTVYHVDPLTQATTKVPLTVTIPGSGAVTGQVFNAGGASQFIGDNFLFVSEDGTVSGWRGSLGTTAETLASMNAIYKGAAYATVGGNGYLYAADFGRGSIDVFKGNGSATNLTGSFTDAALPAGYVPFNVQALAGSLFVTYALREGSGGDETDGADGQPLAIDGLWALAVGNGAGAGSSSLLYFTAGPSDESHGLFGVVQTIPEPRTTMLFGAGLLLLGWGMSRRRDGA